MGEKERRQEAMELLAKAYQAQMRGDMEAALELYTRSLEVVPTAEAYTFRGWARSHQGDLQGAIADCHRAIDVDPEFGNPYNDIGAYHLEMGEPEDAIPWLRMALKAKRYENYCFPHFNLGRAHEARGQWALAADCYGKALGENPTYAAAMEGLERVKARMAEARPVSQEKA